MTYLLDNKNFDINIPLFDEIGGFMKEKTCL
jgi:hypothetical protein